MERTTILAILILSFLASSCYYEAGMEGRQEVKFSAESNYSCTPATRTGYASDAGEAVIGGKERIDWVEGDKIRICNLSGLQVADYSVSAPSEGENGTSVASITEILDPILWTGTGKNTFVAVYPSDAMDSEGVVSPSIPVRQTVTRIGSGNRFKPDMNYAYMVAKATASKRGAFVNLPFYPAMTAFEFGLKLVDGSSRSVTVNGFEMVSVSEGVTKPTALAGTFTWNPVTGEYYCTDWIEKVNDRIAVSFEGEAVTVSGGDVLRFTVFALPQDLTGLKVTFKLSVGDRTLSLKQGGEWTVFEACRKYVISTPAVNPGTGNTEPQNPPEEGEW